MNSKSTHRSLLLGTALASGLICVVAVPQARAQVLPTGGNVISGNAVIVDSNPPGLGELTTVDLNATNSVIHWNTFNVGGNDAVNFVSTNPNSGPNPTGVNTTSVAVLNRVVGVAGNITNSAINGLIDATNSGNNNIAVWLVNPAGITYSGGGATFSGGSLILSTLDVPDSDFPGSGPTTFSVSTGPGTPAGGSNRTVSISNALTTGGNLLVIGQAISLTDTINAGGSGNRQLGSFVVADRVTFPSGVGSPMTFTVETGSTLSSGLQVLGGATIEGSSLSFVAVSQAAAVASLLQVASGAELTAVSTNGVITLATKAVGTVGVTAASADDDINYNVGTGGNRGLIANGGNGLVQLAAGGGLNINGVLLLNTGTGSLTADAATINLANNSVTTGGTQSYTGAVTADGNRTLTGTTVTLAGSYDGDVAGRDLTIAGNAVFNGTVGAAFPLGTLSVSGGSTINGASITTSNNLDFSSTVALGSGTHTLTAPQINFSGAVSGTSSGLGDLVLAGVTTFGSTVGSGNQIATILANDTVAISGGVVSTTGTQIYTQAVTLGANTAITASTATFGTTLDSISATDRSLAITGNAVFTGVVGGTFDLLSLSVSGTSAINGGAVTTSGNQTYTGPATIDTATTTLTGGTIRFGGTLQGTTADTNALVVTGNAQFDGSVGTTTRLTTIDVSGTTAINGAAITTQGNQTYTDAATLGTGLHTLTAPLVTFSSTLDGPGGLALSNDGIFTGAVGGTSRLASLLAPGAITLGTPTVRTTGDQTYGAAMVLDANRTFDSTSGTVRFQSTVDSDGTPRQLTVTGAARFDAAVGATNALASLSVSGASALNGASVRTNTGQTYTGAATLGADTTLTNVTSGTVSFGNTVNSDGTARSLIVAGNASFTGAVGGTAALSALTVNAPATISAAAITANGTIALDAGTSIVTGALTANGATSDVLINQTIAVPGTAQVGGANAGRDFRLRATTVDLAGTQGAVGVYDITSTTGAITGAASLAVTAATIVLDSFSTIDLNIASSLNAGAGDVRLRNADLANVALGNVTAGALVSADTLGAGHGALVGALGSVAGTRITDLTAGNVNVPNTVIAVAGNIRLTSVSGTTVNLAGTNITGQAGGAGGLDPANGRFAVTATGNVDINANGFAQAGAVSGVAVTINGGNIAASGIAGAVDVSSITATGGLNVTAFDNAVSANINEGSISIGSTNVTGATSITNTAGTLGTITVGNKLVGTGDITVGSIGSVLIASFDSGADTGLIRSTAGNIAVNAAGSVVAIGQPLNSVAATGGFDSFAATGNLTVNSTGDVEVGSLSAGGNLTLGIGGALLGSTAAAGTAIPGGALFADGATGTVLVNAGTALQASNDVVSLARVEATGNATLRGDQVAIGVAQVGGTLAIENPLLAALTGADFYVGQRSFVGDATLNLGGGLTLTNLVAVENIGVGNIYNTETLFAGRTAANLSSGAGGAISGTVAAGAQLGTITAGGLINLTTGALVARTVNSGTSTVLATTAGTNSVHTAVAGTALSLTKGGGVLGALGDELRLVSGTANAGSAGVNSSTQSRIGTMAALGGSSIALAQGDISGLRLFGQSAVAVFNTVTDVANPTRLSTNYGAANFTSNNNQAGAQSLGAGSVQAGTISGGSILLSGGFGRAVVIDSLTSTAGIANATASVGTLYIGTVSAATTVTLAKTGGNLTVDGDDLRIGTLSTGGNVTLNSGTHLRVGAGGVTSTGGSIGATVSGDISGFRTALTSDPAYTAAEIPLGDIAASTATTSDGAFSTRYAEANFTANNAAGNLTLTANSGSVQANALSAGNNLSVNARAMTITSGTATAGALSLTAAIGTLHLGTGSSTLLAAITKTGGSATTDGDEMRLGGLTLAAGATINSSTHIRLNTITANGGSVSLTAGGDVSGFKSAALGLAAAEIPLPTVSARTATETGLVLGTRFGLGSIQATGAGADISVLAATGGVQLATVAANRDVSVSARALALGTATATNGFLTLTATQGTLALTGGSAGRAAFLTKQLGSAATDGDELRVTALTGGTGVTLDSSTHVRAGTVTATTGGFTVTAGGDVSGLKAAAVAHPSPAFPGNITTGAQLDSRYGDASLTASTGNLQVTANSGGIQAATLAATLGTVRADARAMTVGTATSGGTMDLTVSTGTLALGTGTAGGIATLTKQAGAVGTDGDDLRVTSFTGATDVNLVSNTSIRAGTVTATTGNVGVTATGGDVSGLLTGTFERLPLVTTGANLSGNYGLAGISATAGNVGITAANGGVQLGGLSAGGNYTVSGRSVSGGVALPIGALSVTATTGTLVLASAGGASVALVKQNGSTGVDGDELRVATVTTLGLADLSSSTHIRSNSVTSTAGNVVLAATAGDITGIKTGAFGLLPTVQAGGGLGTPFSGNYGQIGMSAANAGSVNFSAGNAAQVGTVSAFTSVTGAAGGLSVDTATAGSTLSLTANSGTLSLRTGTAGAGATLIKNGGSVLVDGDELRVGNIVGQTGVSLTSNTSIRSGTARAVTGNLSATTTLGDITGLLTGAFESPVPLVTLTDRLSTNYGFAALEATAGNVVANAANAVQAGTISGGLTDIDGRAVALNSAVAGTSLDVTATTGTLSLLTGTAGTTALFTKQAGAVLTPGDELRVTSFVAGGNITANSNTHVRSNSLTANNGNVSVTATTGDVSGLATGAFERLAAVVTGTRLSANYGQTTTTANGATGTASISAAQGGIQAATITGALDASATARAITVDSAQAGRDLTLTATAGTLFVGNASATTGAVVLIKQGGLATTAGDELRVGAATTTGALTLNSSTAIRAGTLSSTTGAVSLTTTGGDITGLAGVSIGTSDTGFGRAIISGASGVTGTAAGLIQAGSVASSGGAIGLTAGSATADGAIDVSGLNTPGVATLLATAIAPLSAPARDGDIRLGTATVGGLVLDNTVNGGTSGLVEVTGAVVASGDVTARSATAAGMLGAVTAGGNYTVAASGNVILGGSGATVQSAGGAVSISSSNASITQGSGALMLTGNADGVGAEAMLVSGFINTALANTSLVGGNGGRQSAITLQAATGSTAVNTVSSGSLTSTSATGFTAGGAITAGSAGIAVNALAGPATVDIVVSNGGITAQAITATDAGHDIHLGASGAITAGALTAARSIRIDGGTPATEATSFTAASVTATIGTFELRAGSSNIAGPVIAGGGSTIVTTGALQLGNVVSAGPLSVTAGALTADSFDSSDSLTINATSLAVTGATASAGAMNLTTSGAMTLAGVNSGASLTITAGTLDAASLTSAGTTSVTAADIDVTGLASSGGAMTLAAGSGPVQLGSVTSGAGLTASGGSITVAGATTVAGTANLTATTGAVSLAGVNAGQLIANARSGFTASGAVAAGSASLPADPAAGPATVDIVVTNGGITTQAITASGAGHDIHLGASGAIATGAITAAGSVRIDGGTPAAAAASFAAPSVTATSGSLDLRAGTANVSGAATSGGAMTLNTSGATQLGSATAGGALTANAAALTVTGAVNSTGGGVAITTSGATQLGRASASGALAITANNVNVGDAANSTGSTVAITAGSGPVQLGSTSSSGTMTVSGGAITVTGAANSGSTMAFDATGTTLNLGSAAASGAVTLAARTRATLGAVSSSGSTVMLTSADADINGAVSASRITLVNRGAAGNDFRLGGGAAGTSGFALDAAEVNRLGAATVVFDAGTDAGATRQDVSIGTLDLTNAAVRTLEVLSLQRIDLTGNLTRGSGSGLTAMRLGGSATATDRAAVLRIAALPNGTGGMINIGGGTLELRSSIIAAGFDTGFLDQLGVIEGGVPSGVTAWTAADMVSNGASSLYSSAAFSGLIYQPRSDGSLQQHVTAGSMTVRYANFALFQNTGNVGANEGVALGTTASPATPAISIFGPNPPDGGPFAMFGKLNGISDIQTALLGPAVISVNGVDRTTARINGCLIGSGAGCLTTLTLTPSLSNIDPVRANIFFPNADFILPFDPLVGTNNDSLFGDVGTFGLGEIPMTPIECAEGDKSSACSQQQEGAK